jgi:hypothetical protein
MIYEGNLIITADNAEKYVELTEVTGWLRISSEAQFPALTSVGGGLEIKAEAQFPALTSVGGGLEIKAEAQFPALTSVGGGLEIKAEAQLPALTVAHGVKGRLIAVHQYGLWMADNGMYYAGCQGPLNRINALELADVWIDRKMADIFKEAILNDA